MWLLSVRYLPIVLLQKPPMADKSIYRSSCKIGTTVSPLSLWYYAIPVAVSASSEIFVNVTAYSLAYSRAPPNMRGFVMALSLSMQAVTDLITLAAADAIRDPYLVYVFAVPAGLGFVAAFVFYRLFKDLDNEAFLIHDEDADLFNEKGSTTDEERCNSSLAG